MNGRAVLTALLMTAAVAGVMEPAESAEPATQPAADAAQALKRIRAYAPPDAIGVIHIDVSALRKDVIGAFERNPKARKALYGDTIIAALKLLDAADVFLYPHDNQREPRVLVALHGKVTPKDVVAFLASFDEDTAFELQKRENGRYALPRLDADLVAESEADDREGSALLIGEENKFTEQFLATLGQQTSPTLTAMLKKADTKAPAWGAMDFSVFADDDPPKSVVGSLDLRRKTAFEMVMTMRSPEHAGEIVEAMNSEHFPFPELVEGVADGSDVKITAAGGDKAADKLLAAIHKAKLQAQRSAAQSRLRWIGSAVESYQAEHGVPPAGLVVLIESGELSAWALVSPNAERHELETDDKGVPTEPGDFGYLVLPTGAPAELIRAYERPDLHAGEGTNVLLVNGSVEWLEQKEFEKRLAATQDWLAKQSR